MVRDGQRRTALVTGGGRGLGRAIGERLAAEGVAVGLIARTADEVEAAAGAIGLGGGRARGFAADVLDREGFGRAVARFVDWAGGCDTLICAAGRLRSVGPLVGVDLDDWWLDVSTSLRGAAVATRAAWPALRASDSASIQLLIGPGHNGDLAFAAGYGAAQAGLARLAESLAVEGRADRIAVYALNPGLVPTALTNHLLEDPEARRWLPRFTEAFAEGKEVGPEVVAEMAVWLAERRPSALNGRVVSALITPEILETRLDRIAVEGLNVLRLR